jgi:hypothetical protein
MRVTATPRLLRRGAPLLLGAVLLAPPPPAAGAVPGAAPAPPSASSCDELRDGYGIEVIRLFSTAAGAMLDFRYRVVDPEKAAPLFERGTKAYLVNVATKETLAVPTSPKTGQLRPTGVPEAGRTYYMLFSNLHRVVQRGDVVSIVVGKALIPDLVVQ